MPPAPNKLLFPMIHRLSLLTFACLLLANSAAAALNIFPVHDWEPRSEIFTVTADGLEVPVIKIMDETLQGEPTQHSRQLHYIRFAFTGSVTLDISANQPFPNYSIAPYRLAIPSTKSGNTVTITLDKPQKLILRSSDLGLTGGNGLIIFAEAIRPDDPHPGQPNVLNILDRGVDNTGGTVLTQAIYEAIVDVHLDPVIDTLYFPAGTYHTGAIRVPSNVHIFLEAGAVLRFTGANRGDRPFNGAFMFKPMGSTGAGWVENSSIDGDGTLDFQHSGGLGVVTWRARNVAIRNILVRNQHNWIGRILGSNGVIIDNYKALNNGRDALNIDISSNVLVENSFLAAGDDAHCLKITNTSHIPVPVPNPTLYNITSRNNIILQSGYRAINIGAEWYGYSIERVLFENFDIIGGLHAISYQNNYQREPIPPEMVVKDIRYRNIWAQNQSVNFISMGLTYNGRIQDVSFENLVTAQHNANHIGIGGSGANAPEDIENIEFRWLYYQGGVLARDATGMNVKPVLALPTVYPGPDVEAVEIYQPTVGEVFQEGQSIWLRTHAAPIVPRHIASVRFLANGVPVGDASWHSMHHWQLQWTPPAHGTYTIVAEMEDSTGHTVTSDPVVIMVEDPANIAPIISVTTNHAIGPAPLTVAFDASGSTDPDGTIVAYEWDFNNDGTVDAQGSQVEFTFVDEGTHMVRLSVRDDSGGISRKFVPISVGNQLPVPQVSVALQYPTGLVPNTVFMDAFDSYHPDGTIVSWDWDTDYDITSHHMIVRQTGPQISFTVTEGGPRYVLLRVRDSEGFEQTHITKLEFEERSYDSTFTLFGGPTSPTGAYLTGGAWDSAPWNRPPSTHTAALVEWDFSMTESLRTGGNYVGPPILGGVRVERLSGSTSLVNQVLSKSRLVSRANGNSVVNNAMHTASGVSARLTACYYFPLDEPVIPNETTRIESQAGLNGSIEATEVRYVVNEGGLFFISEKLIEFGGGAINSSDGTTGLGLLVMGSPNARFWRAYDPVSGLVRDPDAALRDIQQVPFSRIDGVGFYLDQPALSSGNEQHFARLTLYNVDVLSASTLARFTVDTSAGFAPLEVAFDGSSSVAIAGESITSYVWDFGDGHTASGPTATHTYTTHGTYTASLTVTDTALNTHTAYQQIEVWEPFIEAHIAATPLTGSYPLTVTFDGSASIPLSGTIQSWEWDFGDGSPLATGALTSHTYLIQGTYTATLTVTDSGLNTHTTSVEIVVTDNQPPVAAFTFTPNGGTAPVTIAFDASASSDPDGQIVLYEWDFQSDGTWDATGPQTTHLFDIPGGTFTVTLRVTDDRGATTSESIAIIDPGFRSVLALYGEVDRPATDYLTSSTRASPVSADISTGSLVQWSWNTSSAFIPTGGTYSGPDVFGGMRLERDSGTANLTGTTPFNQKRPVGADVLHLKHTTSGTTARLTAVAFFPLEVPQSAGADTWIESQLGLNGSSDQTEVRYVIQNDGQLFISEGTVDYNAGSFNATNGTSGLGQLLFGSPAGTLWRPYDPATHLVRVADAPLRDISLNPFTQIEGVGVYIDQPQLSGRQEQHIARLTIFNLEDPQEAQDGYAAWAAAHNITGGPEDETGGVTNLMRYALGGDATTAAGDLLPQLQSTTDVDGLTLSLTFHRINDPMLTYSIWFSEDLVDWGTEPVWQGDGANEGVPGLFEVSVPAFAERGFLRLEVSR